MEPKPSKAFMIEAQIMHQIKKQEKRIKELDAMLNHKDKHGNPDPEITKESYNNQWWMCQGAITQLMIVLTCYDNPLSNYSTQE